MAFRGKQIQRIHGEIKSEIFVKTGCQILLSKTEAETLGSFSMSVYSTW